MDGDAAIRDLAATHGKDDLSDKEVREIKTTIAEGCIDDMLDIPPEADENSE